MLPNVNLNAQNEISQPEVTTNKFQNKLSQINSSLKSRMSNIASPSMMIQGGVVNTFGNNAMSQAVMQLGGMLSDMFKPADDSEEQPERRENEEKRHSQGDTILKEILKTLLRIEKSGSGGSSSNSPLKGKKERGDWYPIAAHDKIEVEKERKSAKDIIEKLEKKSPVGRKHLNDKHNPAEEHLSNITAQVATSAEQGFYNAFGYNVLTQGATEGLGMIGDSIKGLFGGKEEEKVAESTETLEETKESKTILQKILASMQDLNKTFKDYFSKKDEKISGLESEFEAGLSPTAGKGEIGSPAMPPGMKAVPPTPPESDTGILDDLGDAANVATALKGTKIGKKIGEKLGTMKNFLKSPGMLKNVAKVGGTIGIAAAPLLAMKGVSDWAGDTEHDEERVTAIQEEVGGPLESFLAKIGLDFKDRAEKQRQKNRAELDGSEYDQPNITTVPKKTDMSWDNVSQGKKSDALIASSTPPDPAKKESVGNQTTVLNNQTVNNQTILPSRSFVRNNDSTANRYFNQEFK